MLRRHCLLTTALIVGMLLTSSAWGYDPVVRTGREVWPEPPLPKLPKAGETLVDPVFCTTLLRVTDEADGKSCHNAYAYWPTFNKDSTRLHINCGGVAMLYAFDPDAFKITGKEKLFAVQAPGGGAPNWEDATWSGTDPDMIFGHTGLNIWAWNVAKKEYTLVRNFAKEFPDPKGAFVSQMTVSIDDEVFAFKLKGPGPKWDVLRYAAWRRKDDRMLLNCKAVGGFDECHVDKSGRYLLVKERKGPIESAVVDLVTGKTEYLTDAAPDFGPGHSDNGHDCVVGAENHRNRILFRKLSDPHRFTTVLDMKNDWSQPKHISMLADDEDWVLVSNYPKQSTPGLFHGEIFQVATDGSERVRRLCHHRSVYKSYWDTPRANISRDGRFVVFTSNWGGSDRRDVFILRVPDIPGKKKQ